MDIEPPIKPATDSDEKSNDSTASQPQHLQEMAKSTVVSKEVTPVSADEAPVCVEQTPVHNQVPAAIPTSIPIQPEVVVPQSQAETKPEISSAPQPAAQIPHHPGIHSGPPLSTQIPPTPSVSGPIAHSQEAPIAPPNVTVSHHQGMLPAGHLPPHGPPGAYGGYPVQGGPPPRAPAPYYGGPPHMPPYQQGYAQYYQPYQQGYQYPGKK